MKKLYIILLVIALLIPVLGGCGGQSASEEVSALVSEVSSVSAAPAVEEEPAEEPSMNEEVVPAAQDILINTEYGDLHYPEQWTGLVEITTAKEGDAIRVTFEAPIGETKYFLFAMVIGGTEGVPAGEMTGPDGVVRSVNLIVEEIVEIPDLSEGEQNRLYAMQEDLNYIIENLK